MNMDMDMLAAPKKIVDGLTEVFQGFAQMFEGVSDEDCEADEEACDCGHGKSCDHCTSKSCDQSDDDDDGIDFDQMVRFIRRRTGMCERTVLAFLAAQIEYLDSVIDEEDEV